MTAWYPSMELIFGSKQLVNDGIRTSSRNREFDMRSRWQLKLGILFGSRGHCHVVNGQISPSFELHWCTTWIKTNASKPMMAILAKLQQTLKHQTCLHGKKISFQCKRAFGINRKLSTPQPAISPWSCEALCLLSGSCCINPAFFRIW